MEKQQKEYGKLLLDQFQKIVRNYLKSAVNQFAVG